MFKRSFNSYFLAYYFYYSNITGRTQPGKKRKRPFKFTFIIEKKYTFSTTKAVPASRRTAFTNFLNLIVLCIRLVRLRRESATARSNKIKGRDRASCPVNRKKALPRELVTPLLSLVFQYVLSFVEMILLRESAKVNTFCRRKISVIFAAFSVICTKAVEICRLSLIPISAWHSHRYLRHCPTPLGRR